MEVGSLKTTTQKSKKGIMPKMLFIICLIMLCVYVLYQQGYIPQVSILTSREGTTLNFVRDIVQVDIAKNQDFIVNENQLIWVTEDGVKALSLEGEEIWSDTHTIKNIVITQRSPYFAVSEKGGRKISIFDTHGKKGEISFANPIMYFSLNKKGDIVVIEGTKDGHVVSAYDEKGNSLGIKRVTYSQDVGHPTVVEISPDGNTIIISYLDTSDAQMSSNIIAIGIGSGGLTKVDNILYGETYKNTVITEIEFINENVWVAIGDNIMSFNRLDGTKIKEINDLYYAYVPILGRLVDWRGVNYPVVSSATPLGSTIHPVETLVFYSQAGESVGEVILEEPSTYIYGDGRTVIVGSDKKFTAYNRAGKQRWQYTATKDVEKMIPLYPQQQVVMISKGKVELMQVSK